MGPLVTVVTARLLQSGTAAPTGTPADIPTLADVGAAVGIQHFQSAAILGALLALIVALFEFGPRLKDRFGDETGELVQSLVATALGIVAATALVDVWNLNDEVWAVLREVIPNAEAGVKVMVSLLVVSIAYTITRLTKRFVKLGEGRDYISRHQQEVLHHVLQIVVFLPAVYFALLLWEVPFQSVLLGAGTLGLVLGLAARQTLGAVLAGFVLLFSRPFRVGDWVVIDGREGVVRDISIVNTRVRTFDHEEVMIPNDEITSSDVVNRTRNGRLRIRTEVAVDYEDDAAEAAALAEEAMDGLDELGDSRSPDVVLKEFADSAVVLELRYWIENPTIHRKWAAQNAVMDAVKEAFDEEGITIPFPQRELSERRSEGFQVAPTREPSADDTDEGDAKSTEENDEGEGTDAERDDGPGSTDEEAEADEDEEPVSTEGQ